MKTVVALFSNMKDAQLTADELVGAGLLRKDILVVTDKDVVGDDIIVTLTDLGVPSHVATQYVDGLHRGGVLETVRVADSDVDRVRDVMNRHALPGRDGGAMRAGIAKTAAEAPTSTEAEMATAPRPLAADVMGPEPLATGKAAAAAGLEQTLSVIEEELVIGKREVERGGVTAKTRIVSKPVEKQVQLREEHVSVERHAVDREAAAGDLPFDERTIEAVEHAEEPVIVKQARIIEEVVIRKDVDLRTETIRDTVRRQDVDIEPYAFEGPKYRENYDELHAGSGYSYDQYRPAYRFGHEMRTDKRFAGEDWSAVEPDARQAWEEKNPGTWEHFKDAVRHAWHNAIGK